MALERHDIFGGKAYLYRRVEGGRWQCAAYIDGRNHRSSTGETSLSAAKEFAERWYLDLRGLRATGSLSSKPSGPTFRQVADRWFKEYDAVTGGSRNRTYVQGNERRIRNYLNPFFGDLPIGDVSTAKVHEYRVQRLTPIEGKQPARSTFHQEMVTLRQILKAAMRYGMMTHLPDLSEPYQANKKIAHRAWFSPPEYTKFTKALRERVDRLAKTRHRNAALDFRDYCLIIANSGLRPDEAKRLQYQDVEIALDPETDETILIIAVRGKRGVGYCKSTTNAVFPFERMIERHKPEPTDPVFPGTHYVLMQSVLDETGLRTDREGSPRSAYSLRHTYISMRLEEGADIYQIAKNCRTSVDMIEKHYASHIKSRISAKAINIRQKPLSKAKQAELDRRNAHLSGHQKAVPADS